MSRTEWPGPVGGVAGVAGAAGEDGLTVGLVVAALWAGGVMDTAGAAGAGLSLAISSSMRSLEQFPLRPVQRPLRAFKANE